MKSSGKSGPFAKMRAGALASGRPWDKCLTEFVQALEPVKSLVNLPRHARLLEEGKAPEGIFVLLRGSVKLFVALKGGKTLILQVIQTGKVLGLSATMSSKAAEYTAETLTPTQFLYVPRKDFLSLLEERPRICLSVVEILSHQLREAVNMIHYSSGPQPAVEKLADLLELWVEECGEVTERGIELKLPLTQEEIGQMIGVSRETVSRLIAEFEQQGILELESSRVRILKGRHLEDLMMVKNRKGLKDSTEAKPSDAPSRGDDPSAQAQSDGDPAPKSTGQREVVR
ncbi:MAG: Crp/Fnr family transcriptional regulator [Acidobacteria bacterium]|nr:MAG: Crp/Fnr family transcriptional regulator [Acidobacteriota bacterium]